LPSPAGPNGPIHCIGWQDARGGGQRRAVKEVLQFVTRGGKHELRRGKFYINVKKGEIYINEKKVIRQPYTNYIMVEPVAVKCVEAVDMLLQPLSPAKE
jgi:hypothetical protein